MTFEDIKSGDTIWYRSHRQFDLLLSAIVISVDRCRKRYCIIKFYHETLKEEFSVGCINNREADNDIATSKEALKNYLIESLRREDERTKQKIEEEIKELNEHRACIENSIERIKKA